VLTATDDVRNSNQDAVYGKHIGGKQFGKWLHAVVVVASNDDLLE